PLSRRFDPELLFEFQNGARPQIFTFRRFAFWDCPRAPILLSKIWATRMNQEHLEVSLVLPKHQQSRAGLRSLHSINSSTSRSMNHPAKHSNSAALERRLALRDLVLFNLVAILGISWVATAARRVFDLARV